jgi:hypothetical protein
MVEITPKWKLFMTFSVLQKIILLTWSAVDGWFFVSSFECHVDAMLK